VVFWREERGKERSCFFCREGPHPPPFRSHPTQSSPCLRDRKGLAIIFPHRLLKPSSCRPSLERGLFSPDLLGGSPRSRPVFTPSLALSDVQDAILQRVVVPGLPLSLRGLKASASVITRRVSFLSACQSNYSFPLPLFPISSPPKKKKPFLVVQTPAPFLTRRIFHDDRSLLLIRIGRPWVCRIFIHMLLLCGFLQGRGPGDERVPRA